MMNATRKPIQHASITNLFDDLMLRNFSAEPRTSFRPAVNITEFDKHFQLDFAAPGYEKQDFQISVEKNQLSVSVKKEEIKTETNGQITRREFRTGNFERFFSLPESVDASKIEAQYQNGLLHVFLPKKEEALAVKKTIEIK